MEEKELYEQVSLAVKHFEDLPDPRLDRSKQYPLIEIIVIALSAVLSEAESFYDIASFGEMKKDWLKQFIALKEGVPSHDTFNRVFSLIDPMHFQTCVLDWVRSVIGGSLTAEDVLAIDGKQIRASAGSEMKAVHMLNVWSHQHGLCLSSCAIEDKTNEITHIPSIIDTLSLLQLAGCIVTVDALNTQRNVATRIKEHDAEYVMALKGNQGTLLEDVKWLFENVEDEDLASSAFTQERNRGRDEYRFCAVIDDLDYLSSHDWPHLSTVAKVVSERTVKAKTSFETRYYLCSFKPDAARLLEIIRAHWEIENKLHWTLDVVFNEDHHDYANRVGVENMAVLRQLALNLLQLDKSIGSLKGKRKKAAWDDSFRAQLLLNLMPD